MKKITSTIFTGLILCSALTIQAQTEVKKFSLNGAMKVAVTSVAIIEELTGNWARSGSDSH